MIKALLESGPNVERGKKDIAFVNYVEVLLWHLLTHKIPLVHTVVL